MQLSFTKTLLLSLSIAAVCQSASANPPQDTSFITADKLGRYVAGFNAIDTEGVKNLVTNAAAAQWMEKNTPLLDCPDTAIEKVYYYRWWTLRKHLKETPEGYVFTEFITPQKHAGKWNTISSALGHHIYEARWLRSPVFLNQYISYWLYNDPKHSVQRFHSFSSWIDDAVYNFYLASGDKQFVTSRFAALDSDYHRWEDERRLDNNMYWQYDVKDAMEESISGSRKTQNRRPSINSYMYGNAVALARMAKLAGKDEVATQYEQKAAELKKLVQQNLWDDTARFFKTQFPDGSLCNAREEIGFIPWYFNLPDDNKKYAEEWESLIDTAAFNAPLGINTAERRHPLYRTHGSGHGCEWDGAVWPFATTQTLKGLAHLLTDYKYKDGMSKTIYYDQLRKYALSHRQDDKIYIGEYMDGYSGEWLKDYNPRSSFYNHSGFCDLVINDLIGIKPQPDDKLKIEPLLPDGKWDWFCLQNVPYHGKSVTIIWDKDGTRYNGGKGLRIYADGKQIGKAKSLKKITVKL